MRDHFTKVLLNISNGSVAYSSGSVAFVFLFCLCDHRSLQKLKSHGSAAKLNRYGSIARMNSYGSAARLNSYGSAVRLNSYGNKQRYCIVYCMYVCMLTNVVGNFGSV